MTHRQGHEPGQRQLLRGDAAEGDRRRCTARAGSSAAGAAVVRDALAQAARRAARRRSVIDGSGLSRLDRWPARLVASLLRSAWADTVISSIFYASLPTAGDQRDARRPDGTGARALARAREDGHDPAPPRRSPATSSRSSSSRSSRTARRVSSTGARASPGPLRRPSPAPPLATSFSNAASSRTATPPLLGLRELRARAPRRRHAGRLLRHRVRDLGALRLERRRRLLARPALERPGDHVRGAGQRPLDGPLRLAGLEAQPELAQLRDEPLVRPRPRTTRRSPRRARGRSPRPRGSPPASPPTSASTEPKCRARFCAVTQPTSGMLSPKSTRENGCCLRALDRLDRVARGDLARSPSNSRELLGVDAGRGRASSGASPSSQKRRTNCSPTPSMSIAAPAPS